ncbi:HK97 gp10 family phage protein [Virgibacillus sp. CBA3643]|uniref:HK97 gp10 family phage protein n=1 Tax=Virgibacillus sp. CBA3643 TaxID=2942278 RepID=UPI0035A274E1
MALEITNNDLKSLLPKFRKALNHGSSLLAQEVWGNIMEFSPQNHGRLSGSWKLQKQGERRHLISTNVEYALVQDQGSDPYEIYPRQAQSLRFQIGGQVIYAKSVSHPGIQGTNYISGAISAGESRVDEFIQTALESEGL